MIKDGDWHRWGVYSVYEYTLSTAEVIFIVHEDTRVRITHDDQIIEFSSMDELLAHMAG